MSARRAAGGGPWTLAGVLLRNELLKLGRRRATLVTLGFVALVATLEFGGSWYAARQSAEATFALPGAWPQVITGVARVGLVFGSVLLILLVASEFSWRTARQNIIDGLSREAWFAGKALLVPLLAGVVVALQVAIGAGFALAGTDLAAAAGLLPDRHQVSALGGVLLAFAGYGSLALGVALAVRGTGASIGVWLLYVVLVERLLGAGLSRLGAWGGEVADWLPVQVFDRLVSYRQHDPEAWRQAARAATEHGASIPAPVPWEALLPAVVGWIAAFLVVSFVVFRRRDL